MSHEKRVFRAVTTDTAFTFSNFPTSATNSKSFLLIITNNGPTGVANVTFPSEVQWPMSGVAPNVTQISNSVSTFHFIQMGGAVFGFDWRRDTVLAAGTGVSLSTNAPTATLTISATGGSGNPTTNLLAYSTASQNIQIIAASGQSAAIYRQVSNGVDSALDRYNFPSSIGWQQQVTSNSAYWFAVNGVKPGWTLYQTNSEVVMSIGKQNSAIPQAKLEIAGTVGGTATPLLSVGTNTTAPGLFVSTNGNVGIGTATPTAALNVVGNELVTGSFTNTSVASFGGDSVLVDAGGHLRIYNVGYLGWSVNGAASGTTDTKITRFGANTNAFGTTAGNGSVLAGSVGIGTTTPTAALEVAAPQNSYQLRINTNTLVVTNGNVGIGKSVPTTALDVSGTITASSSVVGSSIQANSLVASPVYRNASSSDFTVGSPTTSTVTYDATNAYFTGKIGIGTNAPAAKFHIQGSGSNQVFAISGVTNATPTTPGSVAAWIPITLNGTNGFIPFYQ